jgi:hypothetical protein
VESGGVLEGVEMLSKHKLSSRVVCFLLRITTNASSLELLYFTISLRDTVQLQLQ